MVNTYRAVCACLVWLAEAAFLKLWRAESTESWSCFVLMYCWVMEYESESRLSSWYISSHLLLMTVVARAVDVSYTLFFMVPSFHLCAHMLGLCPVLFSASLIQWTLWISVAVESKYSSSACLTLCAFCMEVQWALIDRIACSTH